MKKINLNMAISAAAFSLLLSLTLAACGSNQPTIPAATQTTPPPGTHAVTIDGHTLTLPDGFTISRWVTGQGGLRMMVATDDGLLLVTDMDGGRVLGFRLSEEHPQPITVLSGLNTPSGATIHDNFLFVAEVTQVARYEYQGDGRVGKQEVIIPDLPGGGHVTRTIAVGLDHKLYLTMGSSCNICEEKDQRRAAISRYNIDGTGGEVIATGLRNTVGFVWHPQTGEIWGVDNGRDNIGDDLPPDEVNIIATGKDYGWPYCYGSRVVNPEYADDSNKAGSCEATEPPAVELQAHSAPLGLRFLTEPAWPAAWQNNLFIAFHGSWNRTAPTGYKVVRVDITNQVSDFITGWLEGPGTGAWGRPVDILFQDNTMYITDDAGGSIYRVAPQ